MRAAGAGRIATVVGRYYAMDRDKRWERTKLAYDAIVARPGGDAVRRPRWPRCEASYEAGITDEFIKPIVIVDADGAAVGPIRDGDSVVFFNFRADRARQLTRAIALDDFDGFERPHRPRVHFTTMTVYDRTFGLPVVFDAADASAATSPKSSRRTAAPTSGSPRPRSTRTSRTSSTAAARSRIPARIGSSCRRRRWRPTT